MAKKACEKHMKVQVLEADKSNHNVYALSKTNVWGDGQPNQDASDGENNSQGHRAAPRLYGNKVGDHQTQESKTVRSPVITLRMTKRSWVIQKRKTLLSIIIKNQGVVRLLGRVLGNKVSSIVISMLWVVCNINCLSVCYQSQLIQTHYYVPLQIASTLSFFLHHSMYLRVDILKELSKSFNFWFTVLNGTSFHLCAIVLLGSGIDSFMAALHSFFSMLLLMFYDTHSAKKNKVLQFAVFIGFISYIPVIPAFLFRLVDFSNEKVYFPGSNIEIVDLRLLLIENISTVILYAGRIIYTYLIAKTPSSITFLSHFYEIDETTKPARLAHENTHVAPEVDKAEEREREKDKVTQGPNAKGEGSGASSSHTKIIVTKQYTSGTGLVLDQQKIKELNGGGRRKPDKKRYMEDNSAHIVLDAKNHMIMGILEEKTIEYDTHQTIFHKYIEGKYPRFARVLKSRYYNATCYATTVISMFFSFIVGIGFNHGESFQRLSVAMTSFGLGMILVQVVTLCNFSMFGHLTHSFDFWYVVFIFCKILFSSGVLCGWDIRMLFYGYYIVTLYWCVTIDSFNMRNRKATYMAIIGILCSLAQGILCKMNIGDTFSKDEFIFIGGVRFMSAKITSSSSNFSACIFLVRFLWSYHRNPRRILFMTENVRIESVAPTSP